MHFLTIVQGPKLKGAFVSMIMWRYGQYCQADWISTYAFAWHCYADEVRAGEILVMGWFLYCICMLCLDCLHLYVSLPLKGINSYCAEQKSDLDDCSDATASSQ